MAERSTRLAAFLRLWILMVFSYVILKLLFDLAGPGYADLRGRSLVQLVALPTGQAVIFWLVTRRTRKSAPAGSKAD